MPTGSATVTAEPDEPLERGPWVWPEPVEGGRPPLKRQHSAPEVSEVVAQSKLSQTVSMSRDRGAAAWSQAQPAEDD